MRTPFIGMAARSSFALFFLAGFSAPLSAAQSEERLGEENRPRFELISHEAGSSETDVLPPNEMPLALQAAATAAAPSARRAVVSEGDDLTFIVSPYVWIPTVTGDIGVGAQGLQFELDAGDLLDVFEFGGLIRGEVRHKSGWGLSVDHIFADLGAGVDILIGDVDADIDAGITEVAIVRRIDFDQHALDAYAGIRHWNADVDVAIETFFFNDTIRTGDDWIDPIIGARYLHSVSSDWRLIAQGDIGGFGVGSDFSWNVAAGASYDASDNLSLQLVYRALSVDRESPAIGGGSPVDLNITIQGPLIGLAYRF
ncbi:outer membrane protein [Erythrobacter aurantius]|uniref:outer membrane protein n=1 Tax=Erythrobacter aurantius TaxID=2909249 RepID=UPI00207A3DA8|nr:hypothetical protein [Erythrobacter aurantius]